MKHLLFIAVTLMVMLGCKQGNAPATEKESAIQRQADSLQILLDSCRAVKADTLTQVVEEPAVKPITRNTEPSVESGFEGKHKLTLQWISWDRPGTVIIGPKGSDGFHSIKGSQAIAGDYVKIEGKIRKISNLELEFTGLIESKVETVNAGKVCRKEGNQIFLSTKGRKYWRLQNMLNCEGNMVTDYVDIYF